MNLAAVAVLAPLLIALGGVLSYFVAKVPPQAEPEAGPVPSLLSGLPGALSSSLPRG